MSAPETAPSGTGTPKTASTGPMSGPETAPGGTGAP